MFALNLLGGAALTGVNGPVDGKAAHKRRIALLAILAVARGRTVGRERLIGLLWADHRTAAARHLLSESLYVLRKELGAGAFVSAGDEVGLNGEVVRSDVEEFEAHIDQGAVEQAARLYRGPFLDGFFVPGAAEFEQWAEGERARLARTHSRALECLADARETEGSPAEAAEWWRRLTVLDPSNSRVGMRLMQALDAAGERGAALWFAQSHVAYLDAEVGVEPDDDFLDLVDRLKTEPVRVPKPASPASASVVPSVITGPAVHEHASSPEPGVSPAGNEAGSGDGDPAGTGADAQAVNTLAEPPPSSAVQGVDAVPVSVDGLAAATGERDTGDRPPAVAGYAGPDHVAERPDGASERFPVDEPVGVADVAAPRGAAPEFGAGRRGAEEEARRVGWRAKWRARVRLGAAAGLMLGAVLAFARRGEEPAPPVAGGYDPRRIAVLYFDDDSRGGELGYLAAGLTESLIHALGQVPALEVISRNGVKPYRGGTVPLSRVVADLQAGTVVEGSVQRSGDSVRVTVDLVDARTQAHVESRTLTHALRDVFSLEDALADSVSVFLRRRVGTEVHLRRTAAETKSAAAWRAVLEAEQASDDAASLQKSDDALARDGVLRLLDRADSLLAAAERMDPEWTRPTVQRGWIALRRAPLVRETAGSQAAALSYAGRALALRPADPLALELRGSVRFAQALAPVDSAGQTAGVEAAERDLRAAIAGDPRLAGAWSQLSQVLRYRGRAAEAASAARKAMSEDAWLDDADAILSRLYFGALYAADYPQARSLCAEAHRRFPADWRFVECRLTLLRADPSRPGRLDEALALLAELDRLDPPERARRQGRPYSPAFRLAVAAAVAAREGDADAARALLARARGAAGTDPDLRVSLAYDEAVVRLRLGEAGAARALLRWSFARRPALRPFAARDPLLTQLPRQPAPAREQAPAPASR